MANYLAQFQTIKSSCDRIVIAGTVPLASPLYSIPPSDPDCASCALPRPHESRGGARSGQLGTARSGGDSSWNEVLCLLLLYGLVGIMVAVVFSLLLVASDCLLRFRVLKLE
jgi:hypothetical protein